MNVFRNLDDNMKTISIIVLIAVAGTLAIFMSQACGSSGTMTEKIAPTEIAGERQPILVELFTSEGCSSCPPADKVLAILQNDQLIPNAEVIALAFHVDYWNYLGWKDRFSSADFSNRQADYAKHFKINSSYTPQMVVDGSFEFVGSNRAKANEIIAATALLPKAAIELALDSDKLSASITNQAAHQDATVYLATAESRLSTKVGGGENSGSLLEHTSVVRELTSIGSIKKNAVDFRFERDVPPKSDWKIENLKYVVFVQENLTRRILAVKQISR